MPGSLFNKTLFRVFRPNGTMDQIGRFFTPGASYFAPARDPFYAREIVNGPMPENANTPDVTHAQQLANRFGDTTSAASTVGVRGLSGLKGIRRK